jgi:hypothetical protein
MIQREIGRIGRLRHRGGYSRNYTQDESEERLVHDYYPLSAGKRRGLSENFRIIEADAG